MPSLAELENPQNDLSTDVLAADGTTLGRYFVTDRSNSSFRKSKAIFLTREAIWLGQVSSTAPIRHFGLEIFTN